MRRAGHAVSRSDTRFYRVGREEREREEEEWRENKCGRESDKMGKEREKGEKHMHVQRIFEFITFTITCTCTVCMYHVCTSNTCTVHVLYMYSTCTIMYLHLSVNEKISFAIYTVNTSDGEFSHSGATLGDKSNQYWLDTATI